MLYSWGTLWKEREERKQRMGRPGKQKTLVLSVVSLAGCGATVLRVPISSFLSAGASSDQFSLFLQLVFSAQTQVVPRETSLLVFSTVFLSPNALSFNMDLLLQLRYGQQRIVVRQDYFTLLSKLLNIYTYIYTHIHVYIHIYIYFSLSN